MAGLTQGGAGRPDREAGSRCSWCASGRIASLAALLAGAGFPSHVVPPPVLSCSAGLALPNQPSGFACGAVVDFGSGVPTASLTGSGVVVSRSHVSSSPTADHDVVRLKLSKGWGGADAVALAAGLPLKVAVRVVYLAVVLRVKSWEDPENQADSQVRLELSGTDVPSGSGVTLGLMGAGDAGLTPALRLSGIFQPFALPEDPSLASFTPVLPANLPAAPQLLTQNQWHTWEILVTLNSAGQTDGRLSWSVDGQAAGAYEGLGLAEGDPTVTGARLQVVGHGPLEGDQTEWLDEFYVGTPASAAAPDRVDIANNTVTSHSPDELPDPATETVTLLDAADATRASLTCLQDTVVPQSPSFTNLTHTAPCGDNELAIFSVDDAVLRDMGASGVIWSDQPGETRPVTLHPRIEVPVVIWLAASTVVVKDDDGNDKEVAVRDLAERDVQFATVWYNLSRAGVRFVPTVRNVASDAAAVTAIGTICDSRVLPQNTQSANDLAMFAPETLNVYYVAHMGDGFRGYHCYYPPYVVSANMIYVDATIRSPSTLAHELGHAFSLQHVNSDIFTGFEPDNLMWDGEDNVERRRFTLGQAYRVNLEELSMVNQNHPRHDARDCDSRMSLRDPLPSTEADSPNGPCPRLSLPW
jgi:hypothetical protein